MREDILETIYRKYYYPLFLYAYSLTHHIQDAEDLVSETFVKAFLSYEENSGNIKNWLLVVLKNRFINEYKKKKRYVDYPIESISDTYETLKNIIHDNRKRWMYTKIYELKEPSRSIILLKIQLELKDEEIAEYLNLSVESIRTIRYRTKNHLKKLAEKEGWL